jgi:hypothetical protein
MSIKTERKITSPSAITLNPQRKPTGNMTRTLTRACPRTGFKETIEYEGPLRLKPKGWRVVQ